MFNVQLKLVNIAKDRILDGSKSLSEITYELGVLPDNNRRGRVRIAFALDIVVFLISNWLKPNHTALI